MVTYCYFSQMSEACNCYLAYWILVKHIAQGIIQGHHFALGWSWYEIFSFFLKKQNNLQKLLCFLFCQCLVGCMLLYDYESKRQIDDVVSVKRHWTDSFCTVVHLSGNSNLLTKSSVYDVIILCQVTDTQEDGNKTTEWIPISIFVFLIFTSIFFVFTSIYFCLFTCFFVEI